jgi:hypothetical protein
MPRPTVNPHTNPGTPHSIEFPKVPKREITTDTPSKPDAWGGFDNPTIVGDAPYVPQRFPKPPEK